MYYIRDTEACISWNIVHKLEHGVSTLGKKNQELADAHENYNALSSDAPKNNNTLERHQDHTVV